MTVFFRPCGDLTKAPKPRSDRDLELYAFLTDRTGLTVSHEHDDFVDYEDWMEPACLLRAALEEELEILILPRCDLRRAVMNPVQIIEGKECRDILIGRQLERDPFNLQYFDLGWPVANNDLPNHYPELKSFQDNAGRRLALADMPGEPNPASQKPRFNNALTSTSLATALEGFAGESCLVKQVYPAKILPLLTLEPTVEMTSADYDRLFIDQVGYHFCRFEGDRASLLVQEQVEMSHETRFFVIGGKVICGAACIESHTPQVNDTGEILRPEFEIFRNTGCYTTDLQARKKLLHLAEDVVRQISVEAPDLRNYVLDVALGNNWKPLVIELNPADQSGLYGIDAGALFRAILAEAEHQPHHEPEQWVKEDFLGREPEPSVSPAEDLIVFLDDDEDDHKFASDTLFED